MHFSEYGINRRGQVNFSIFFCGKSPNVIRNVAIGGLTLKALTIGEVDKWEHEFGTVIVDKWTNIPRQIEDTIKVDFLALRSKIYKTEKGG